MVNAVEVGIGGVAASLVLVVIAVVLSRLERLELERSILWAATRAMGQMLVIGGALGLVLADDASIVLSWAWVALMVGIGAATVTARTPEVPRTFPTAFVALGAAEAISLLVIYGLGVFPLEPRTLVPVAGMLMGNTIAATVLATRRTLTEIDEHREQIEVRLSLGQTARRATQPHLAAAMRTAVTPQIEQTKIVGLIALPGTMTGLLLAGASPLDAVLTQTVVMFLILGSVAVTSVLVGRGTANRLVTADHRLALSPRHDDSR
jgi:putative ABC transport system permease protein